MSHIVTIQARVKDAAAVAAACRRLGLEMPRQGTAMLFGGEVSGLLVALPQWQYPLVIDVAAGDVRYDNYNGMWGEPSRLDAFLQMYAVEKAKIEAQRRGGSVREQTLEDGSIRLHVVGGF